MSPGPMNNDGAGLAPLGVEGVLGRDPSLDLVGVPGTGARDLSTGALVVRIRDSVERAALYFLAVLKMEGVVRSLPAAIERGRFGVNGVGRASLDVEGVSVIMATLGSLKLVVRWVLILDVAFISVSDFEVVNVVGDGPVVVVAVEDVRDVGV